MRSPSLWQILVIVLIIVVIFGAKRLPDVASSIGRSLKIFKKEVSELREDGEASSTGADGHQPTYGQQPTYGDPPPTRHTDPGATSYPPGGSGTDRR